MFPSGNIATKLSGIGQNVPEREHRVATIGCRPLLISTQSSGSSPNRNRRALCASQRVGCDAGGARGAAKRASPLNLTECDAQGRHSRLILYGAFFVKGSNLAPMFFCGTGSGHLAGRRRSGLRDNQRGNPPSCAAHGRDTTLYSVAPYEAHHDAVIRILGEVPRRRPHSPCRRLKPW